MIMYFDYSEITFEGRSHGRGHRFESCTAHHIFKELDDGCGIERSHVTLM